LSDSGASAARAAAMGNLARFAARIGTNEWTGEFMIPLKAAGIDLSQTPHLDFSIRVFRAETREWTAWGKSGDTDAGAERAGQLKWNPAVDAAAEELLRNGDMEAGSDGLTDWHALWWDTSRETEAEARDPKCAWVRKGLGGPHGLEIRSDSRERMRTRQAGFTQQIGSPGPGTYLLTYDLRADNLALTGSAEGGSFSSYVHVVLKNGEHGSNLGQSFSTVRQGSFGWTRFQVPVQIPAEAGKLDVIFQLQRMTGTVWIDNVSLKAARVKM
jgi:hypothetical protein